LAPRNLLCSMTKIFPPVLYFGFVAILIVWLGVGPTNAQDSDVEAGQEPLTVGVYVHPPFVMEDNGSFHGMAIDLWEWLAEQLDLEPQDVELANVDDLVDATTSGEIDVAVTNMTVTRDRVERIDFPHPWFDAGQRIMISEDSSGGFGDVIA